MFSTGSGYTVIDVTAIEAATREGGALRMGQWAAVRLVAAAEEGKDTGTPYEDLKDEI